MKITQQQLKQLIQEELHALAEREYRADAPPPKTGLEGLHDRLRKDVLKNQKLLFEIIEAIKVREARSDGK